MKRVFFNLSLVAIGFFLLSFAAHGDTTTFYQGDDASVEESTLNETDSDLESDATESSKDSSAEDSVGASTPPLSKEDAQSYCISREIGDQFCSDLMRSYGNGLTADDIDKITAIREKCTDFNRCGAYGYGIFGHYETSTDYVPPVEQDIFTDKTKGNRSSPEQHWVWTAKSVGLRVFVEHQIKYVLAGKTGNKELQHKLFSDEYDSGLYKRQVDSASQRKSQYSGEYGRKVTPELLKQEPFRSKLSDYLSSQHDANGDDYTLSVSIVNNYLSHLAKTGSVDGHLDLNQIFKVNLVDERGEVRLSEESPKVLKGDLYIPSDLVMQMIADHLFFFDHKIDFLNIVSEHKELLDKPSANWQEHLTGEYKNYFLLDHGGEVADLDKQACQESLKKGWVLPQGAKTICAEFLSDEEREKAVYCNLHSAEKCVQGNGDEMDLLFSKLNAADQKHFEFLARCEVIREAVLLELRNNPELISKSLLISSNGVESGNLSALGNIITAAVQKYGNNPSSGRSAFAYTPSDDDYGISGFDSGSGSKFISRLSDIAQQMRTNMDDSSSHGFSSDEQHDPEFIDVLQDPNKIGWSSSGSGFELTDGKGRTSSYSNFYEWYSEYVKLPADVKIKQNHNLGMADAEWPVYGVSSHNDNQVKPVYFPKSSRMYTCEDSGATHGAENYCGPGPHLKSSLSF